MYTVVEKALQDVRGLQGELAAFGVPGGLADTALRLRGLVRGED